MTGIAIIGHLTLDNVCDMTTGVARFCEPQGAALGAVIGARLSTPRRISLVAKVGSNYPRAILNDLSNRGVDCSQVERIIGASLGFWILRETENHGQDLPISGLDIGSYTPEGTMLPLDVDHIEGAHICPMPLPDQVIWATRLAEHTQVISVDPQPSRYCPDGYNFARGFEELMSLVTIASLSTEDFPDLDVPSDAQAALLRELGAPIVTLKRGAKGAIVIDSRSGDYYDYSPAPANVIDVVGAGDAFAGAFLGAYVDGRGVAESGVYANCAASIIIEGTAMTHALDQQHRYTVRVRDFVVPLKERIP